jgi:hypothetical protein
MSSSSSPCAACKLLRRKCTQGCVFAPYFPPDSPAKFANVHRVFGASNVSKILSDLPPHQRGDAVTSLAYEAEARLRDPVYGCVSYITILQCQVNEIREQIATARKELAGYIGPAAFGALVALPPQYHHPAAAQYAGMHLGQQQMVQLQHHHQQQMAEAQQMAAAAENARDQGVMTRQAAAYAQAAPGGGAGATVAIVPHETGAPYDGGGFLLHQQPASQAQTAMALTYQMESSPPPSSSGQSPAEEVSHQQHTDGSDEGSGGVAQPA